MKMIAFGHRKNVGKDTAGRFLCSHLRIANPGSHIQKVSFAYKMKLICFELYAWAGVQHPDYYEDNPKEKEKLIIPLNKTVRRIWVEYEMKFREVYGDTWVDYLFYNTVGDLGIITDLRFPNEADRVLYHGGYVIRIDRPGIVHVPNEADDPLETYKNWSQIIVNDSDVLSLYKKIVDLSNELNLLKR